MTVVICASNSPATTPLPLSPFRVPWTDQLPFHSLPDQQADSEPALLSATGQLPDLGGESLVLTWDQLEAESIILHEDRVIWREKTGWEVYERFEEIAGILKQKYGKRLKDLVPTTRSLYALYGDSTRAYFHVIFARESLSKEG